MKTKFLTLTLAASAFLLNACSSAPAQTAYPQPYAYAMPQANNGYVQPNNAYAMPPSYAPQPSHYYQGLPQSINEQIQKLYPGSYIVDIDYEPYGYEVDLNNRMQLHFDTRGNLLGQKWD